MTFTFAAAVAWDPIGKQAVKNTSFQVYATADTGFVTPLAITDTFGVALPGNILNSGSQGVFPEFEQAAESTVVITDPSHTYVWTITAIMQDGSVAAFVGKSGSASRAAVRAAIKADMDNPASDIATQLSATYAGKQAPPTTAAAAGLYDRRLNVYNLKPKHLRRARAALGKAYNGFGNAGITIVSDSTGAGTGSGNSGADSWPARLRKLLVTAGCFQRGTGIVMPAPNSVAETRWNLGAGWAAWGDGSSAIGNSTTLNAATFTSDLAGTIVRVYYGKNLGALTVSIDGAAAVTVPTAAGTTGDTAVYEVTGLANTTHTVAIKSAATGTFPMIQGAEVRTPSGLSINNISTGGAQSSVLSNTSPWWNGKLAASAPVASDLIIPQYMINDANNGASVATYKTRMLAGLDVLAASGADIVLMTPMPISGTDLTGYVAALYEIADARDLPLIDFYDRHGTYTISNGNGLMYDTLHPNAFGYADMARSVMIALGL